MQTQTSVDYGDIPLDVSGEYIPYDKGSRFEPPSGGHFEELTVELAGHDITEMLSEEAIDYIEKQAIEKIGIWGL